VPVFTQPHLLTFTDKNGTPFVLKPGSKILDEISQLHFNHEENDEARIIGDIIQMSFRDMSIEDIEKEYGQVERIVNYEEAIKREGKDHKIPQNVFDLNNDNRAY
jgi:hypothetical protein